RPGGLYVIEDWAWAHWSEYQHPRHRWAADEALTTLIVELIEALGTSMTFISNATIFQGFAVIERGGAELDPLAAFRLADHTTRRPDPSVSVKPGVLQRVSRRAVRRWRGT